MVTLKKYGNRRLYHTGRSSYVNLEEVTRLIRGGERIQVVDAKTGEDLTREVLLQVLMEALQGNELFTTSMLHRIIRSTGDDPWSRMMRQQLAAGLGLLSAQMDQLEGMMPKTPGAPPPAPSAAPEPSPEEDSAPHSPSPEPAASKSADQEMDALRERLAALEDRLKRG